MIESNMIISSLWMLKKRNIKPIQSESISIRTDSGSCCFSNPGHTALEQGQLGMYGVSGGWGRDSFPAVMFGPCATGGRHEGCGLTAGLWCVWKWSGETGATEASGLGRSPRWALWCAPVSDADTHSVSSPPDTPGISAEGSRQPANLRWYQIPFKCRSTSPERLAHWIRTTIQQRMQLRILLPYLSILLILLQYLLLHNLKISRHGNIEITQIRVINQYARCYDQAAKSGISWCVPYTLVFREIVFLFSNLDEQTSRSHFRSWSGGSCTHHTLHRSRPCTSDAVLGQ